VLKTITTIKTSGSRLLNLINDILDAASMRTVRELKQPALQLVNVVAGQLLFETRPHHVSTWHYLGHPGLACCRPQLCLEAAHGHRFTNACCLSPGWNTMWVLMPALSHVSMQQGKLVIKHEKVNLTRLVDDVLELCQPLVSGAQGVDTFVGVHGSTQAAGCFHMSSHNRCGHEPASAGACVLDVQVPCPFSSVPRVPGDATLQASVI
jgi:hypothetical protein